MLFHDNLSYCQCSQNRRSFLCQLQLTAHPLYGILNSSYFVVKLQNSSFKINLSSLLFFMWRSNVLKLNFKSLKHGFLSEYCDSLFNPILGSSHHWVGLTFSVFFECLILLKIKHWVLKTQTRNCCCLPACSSVVGLGCSGLLQRWLLCWPFSVWPSLELFVWFLARLLLLLAVTFCCSAVSFC
jgi:hypothetical protein